MRAANIHIYTGIDFGEWEAGVFIVDGVGHLCVVPANRSNSDKSKKPVCIISEVNKAEDHDFERASLIANAPLLLNEVFALRQKLRIAENALDYIAQRDTNRKFAEEAISEMEAIDK